jgi:hypothetical protein
MASTATARLPAACLRFSAMFSPRVRDGLPLHVRDGIGSATGKRHDVVLHVTGACAACVPRRRTSVRQLELALKASLGPLFGSGLAGLGETSLAERTEIVAATSTCFGSNCGSTVYRQIRGLIDKHRVPASWAGQAVTVLFSCLTARNRLRSRVSWRSPARLDRPLAT